MFRIDLHIHTSYGSPCGYMTPFEAIRRARELGLNGICLTEHDYVWDQDTVHRLADENQFLVIGGAEVGTDCGHILVFGLHGSVRNVVKAKDLRSRVSEVDGVMIAAHPLREEYSLFRPMPTIEEVACLPVLQVVDAVEVYNGHSAAPEREFTRQVATHLNLPHTGGSDAHSVLGVGNCYTVFEKEITCERELIEEIKQGRCWAALWDDARSKK